MNSGNIYHATAKFLTNFVLLSIGERRLYKQSY
jgi:hypothetical protein